MIETQALVFIILVIALFGIVAGNKGTINVSLNFGKPVTLPTWNPTSSVTALDGKKKSLELTEQCNKAENNDKLKSSTSHVGHPTQRQRD